MDKHLFVDTNILIDVLTGRDGSEASKRLFALAHLKKVQLSVSALSIVNAVYICKRYKMDIAAVLKALQTISTFVQVEDFLSYVVKMDITLWLTPQYGISLCYYLMSPLQKVHRITPHVQKCLHSVT